MDAINLNLCDKCGKRVSGFNNIVELEILLGGLDHFTALFVQSRHFLPEGDCPGSPSRAQYIEGQPRDSRGYPYIELLENPIREAYREMQAVEHVW